MPQAGRYSETFFVLAPMGLYRGPTLGLWAQMKVKSTYRRYSQVASRGNVTGRAAAAAVMEAAGTGPLMTNGGQILDERGDCDGAYTVAVFQTATDHALEATQRVMDVVDAKLVGNGVNGVRAVRGLAAGHATGTYLGIFYVDSLDAYASAIQGLYANADFQAAAASSGLTVVERSFSRKV